MSLRSFFSKKHNARLAVDTLTALSKAQAFIEFEPDGTIISANENFLQLLGYSLDEVQGKHHSMFVDHEHAASPRYLEFWENLRAGKVQATRFKRFGKGGREVWIEASYNPLIGEDGKVYRVVKAATDVTARHIQSSDAKGQLAAISRSQAVIEFNLDGKVLSANSNFCQALGYELGEIVGHHHRMFVASNEANSGEYSDFWSALKRGEYRAAEFKRIGKGGREVWIQATYNPILDDEGRPYKVVKYATDITARKCAVNQLSSALWQIGRGRPQPVNWRSIP